ncbi:MAG: hypothetical protein KAV40_02305, partial [Thermoplasmatales archaeon]|nr:hypothetical protein [Thermoplasmatales archaeon]
MKRYAYLSRIIVSLLKRKNMIPIAKDFFNKVSPNMCNRVASLKFYCKDNSLQAIVLVVDGSRTLF